jgi:hypothetical protein
MQSPDTFAESASPLKSRDGSSAASPAPGSADNTVTRALRFAAGQCVAQPHDGIETLRRCVRAARADGVKPEHIVLLIHTAWDDYDAGTSASAERDRKRLHLTGVAMDAYCADE